MKCQSYGFAEAARTRSRTLSRSMSGLRTSLTSRTSAEPYFWYAIAFIPISSYRLYRVYIVHPVRSVGVRRTLVKGKSDLAKQIEAPRRAPLSRGRVLRAAV